MDGHQIPVARTERLIVEALGDELLVYDLDDDRAHSLDPVAASIWRACDGESTVADVALRAGVSKELAWSTLEHLADIDLLAEPVLSSSAQSRRTLLRRGLMAGAASVAVGAGIQSIVAPAAAGTSSCLGDGNVCTASIQCCPGLTCCCEAPTCFCRAPSNCND
jgi:hypothetical protein